MTTVSKQQELSRRRYLDAMGITSYLSRRQLPAAAPTMRLAIAARVSGSTPMPDPGPSGSRVAPASATAAATSLSSLVGDPVKTASGGGAASPVPAPADAATGHASPGLRFSLAVLFAGGIAWLEDLGGRPLASAQVQLVQAMARALGAAEARPEVLQFDWPPHHNRQLDLGPDTARAALSGFLGRQLEQRSCRGVVLMGDGHLAHIPGELLSGVVLVRTRSSLAMLEQPALKRQVWVDLQPLVPRD